MELDDIAAAVWAKIDRDNDLPLSLPQHLLDTAQTAALVWDEFLPQPVRLHVAKVAGGDEQARTLAIFLAGVHDIGKASPAFEIQGTPHLISACEMAGLEIDPRLKRDRKLLPHGLAGQIVLEQWLEEHHHWTRKHARTYASVVGGHHGLFPEQNQLNTGHAVPHLLGTNGWKGVREHLLTQMSDGTGATDYLKGWSQRSLPRTVQILLTACVIVSDWIASNTNLFRIDLEDEERQTRARDAWQQLNLPQPWIAVDDGSDADELLASRFGLTGTVRARPVQLAALELCEKTSLPGLFIIEAPMGSGKTEAGLLLAEQLAIRLGVGGLIFALPSMATSDAMFSRTQTWLGHLPDAARNQQSVFLAHSKAHLNEEFGAIPRSSRFADVEADATKQHDTTALVHDWLTGRKKGVLSNFVIGTIDQVLFTALKSKHLALRHLGLAGKVVIIDEVHAADHYMAVYLDRTLEWLGAYSVPVILLSATLPGARRKAMTKAYDVGRGVYVEPPFVRPGRGQAALPATTSYDALATHTGYPLLTATSSDIPIVEVINDSGHRSTVQVAPLDDDGLAIKTLLDLKLADGGCAVVIHNTVSRAQETYELLRASYGDKVTLIHSRFVATDRMIREDRLRRQFGPPTERTTRPERHIVVATQVVEQSLDVDFDLMITDIAPVDLVLQRSGRLHRHLRDRRPHALREPSLFVIGVQDWSAAVPEPDRGAIAVYGADALLRSLAVLNVPSQPLIQIPNDIPLLVQAAYAATCPVPNGWEQAMEDARAIAEHAQTERRKRAETYLIGSPIGTDLTGWTADVSTDLTNAARGHAAVRDGQESLEVIVVQRRADGQIYRWGASGDEPPVPTEYEPPWRVAHRVAASTLRLAPALTQPYQIDHTLDDLERTRFEGWQASSWLREQLVLVLDETCQASLAGFHISYDDELGLLTTRQREI